MSQTNSQEQTIYHRLAGQIQLGFFQDGERFPSALEIADCYKVSFCPAQRALKALERDGLIKLCRGKETIVLGTPNKNYLESDVFKKRAEALIDLTKTLKLITFSIGFQGICYMDSGTLPKLSAMGNSCNHQGKHLYRLFNQSLQALGSQMIMSLYYDISTFAESAFLDILQTQRGEEASGLYFKAMSDAFLESLQDCHEQRRSTGRERLQQVEKALFEELEHYLGSLKLEQNCQDQETFLWEPHKGRTRHYDVVATDLICKINQGIYPVGTLLPNGAVLADVYHISAITVRRTIEVLSKLGVTETINGVGTRVVFAGDSAIPYKLKDLMMDDNLRSFLEALQMLTITSEAVMRYTYPFCSAESLGAIIQAVAIKEQNASMVATLSACLQAVVHCCPLMGIREIYSKLTLQLLHGSVLRLNETGEESVSGWPEFSADFSESLKAGDGRRIAAAFSRLCENNFNKTKKTLIGIGVVGADKVKTPV